MEKAATAERCFVINQGDGTAMRDLTDALKATAAALGAAAAFIAIVLTTPVWMPWFLACLIAERDPLHPTRRLLGLVGSAERCGCCDQPIGPIRKLPDRISTPRCTWCGQAWSGEPYRMGR